MHSGIQSLAGLQRKKHWSATSKTWTLFECSEAAKHYLNQIPRFVLKHYSTLKAPVWLPSIGKRHWSVVQAWWRLAYDVRHTALIIQSSKLAAVVSFHLKWEKPPLSGLRHDEDFWFLSIQGPVFAVFGIVCVRMSWWVCVCVWVCVFALCSLLWECCSRWCLLTELELSFHTGGN